MSKLKTKLIGAGLAVSAISGAGTGIGAIFSSVVSSVARKACTLKNQLFRYAILCFALPGAIVRFGLVLSSNFKKHKYLFLGLVILMVLVLFCGEASCAADDDKQPPFDWIEKLTWVAFFILADASLALVITIYQDYHTKVPPAKPPAVEKTVSSATESPIVKEVSEGVDKLPTPSELSSMESFSSNDIFLMVFLPLFLLFLILLGYGLYEMHQEELKKWKDRMNIR